MHDGHGQGQGAHGHDAAQTYAHTHGADGCTHTHAHTHGAGHEDVAKLRQVLSFTLEHNRAHAGELSAFAEKLRALGCSDAAQLMLEGAADYENGNEKLARALRFL